VKGFFIFYVASICNSVHRLLRRTLVHSVILLNILKRLLIVGSSTFCLDAKSSKKIKAVEALAKI
jgi:hypothetical protein